MKSILSDVVGGFCATPLPVTWHGVQVPVETEVKDYRNHDARPEDDLDVSKEDAIRVESLTFWQMASFHMTLHGLSSLRGRMEPNVSVQPHTSLYMTDDAKTYSDMVAYWHRIGSWFTRHVVLSAKPLIVPPHLVDSKWIRWKSGEQARQSIVVHGLDVSINLLWVDCSRSMPSHLVPLVSFVSHVRAQTNPHHGFTLVFVNVSSQDMADRHAVLMSYTPFFQRHGWWTPPAASRQRRTSWFVLDGPVASQHGTHKECFQCFTSAQQQRPAADANASAMIVTPHWLAPDARTTEPTPLAIVPLLQFWQTAGCVFDHQWARYDSNFQVETRRFADWRSVPVMSPLMQEELFGAVGLHLRPVDHYLAEGKSGATRNQEFNVRSSLSTASFKLTTSCSIMEKIQTGINTPGGQAVYKHTSHLYTTTHGEGSGGRAETSGLASVWAMGAVGFALPPRGLWCALWRENKKTFFIWPNEMSSSQPREAELEWACDDAACMASDRPHCWWDHLPDCTGLVGVVYPHTRRFIILDVFLLPRHELVFFVDSFEQRHRLSQSLVASCNHPSIIRSDPLGLTDMLSVMEQMGREEYTYFIFRGHVDQSGVQTGSHSWIRWDMPMEPTAELERIDTNRLTRPTQRRSPPRKSVPGLVFTEPPAHVLAGLSRPPPLAYVSPASPSYRPPSSPTRYGPPPSSPDRPYTPTDPTFSPPRQQAQQQPQRPFSPYEPTSPPLPSFSLLPPQRPLPTFSLGPSSALSAPMPQHALPTFSLGPPSALPAPPHVPSTFSLGPSSTPPAPQYASPTFPLGPSPTLSAPVSHHAPSAFSIPSPQPLSQPSTLGSTLESLYNALGSVAALSSSSSSFF